MPKVYRSSKKTRRFLPPSGKAYAVVRSARPDDETVVRILRRAGKYVVVTSSGSDSSRTEYMSKGAALAAATSLVAEPVVSAASPTRKLAEPYRSELVKLRREIDSDYERKFSKR